MDDLTFYRGWALLTAQPYAQFLAFDETKLALQEALYRRTFQPLDGPTWMRVVIYWTTKEETWPLPASLLALMKAKAPYTPKQLDFPKVPHDYLPRRIMRSTPGETRSIAERAMALMPEFLATCPKDSPDYEWAQEFYGKAVQGWPVRCTCGRWHPACQPCPTCDPERYQAMCRDKAPKGPLAETIQEIELDDVP